MGRNGIAHPFKREVWDVLASPNLCSAKLVENGRTFFLQDADASGHPHASRARGDISRIV